MIENSSGQDIVVETKPLWLKILVPSILSALVIALLIMFSGDNTQATVKQQLLTLAVVKSGALSKSLSISGQIKSLNSPSLYAPEQGQIKWHVLAGQQVEKGQLISTLTSHALDSELELQQAQLNNQNSELQTMRLELFKLKTNNEYQLSHIKLSTQFAARELERAALSKNKAVLSDIDYFVVKDRYDLEKNKYHYLDIISKQDVQFLEQQIQTKKMAIVSQDVVIKELQRRLNSLAIHSPTTGVIGTLSLKNGDWVGLNQQLVTIVDATHLVVDALVPEAFIVFLATGMSAKIDFGTGHSKGKILSISSEVTKGKVAIRTSIESDNTVTLKNNKSITLEIDAILKNNTLLIPRGPFYEQLKRHEVFIKKGNVLFKQVVQYGLVTQSQIEILSGLSKGSEIVISDVTNFAEHALVQVLQ
jgi:HlyD family secretion protein